MKERSHHNKSVSNLTLRAKQQQTIVQRANKFNSNIYHRTITMPMKLDHTSVKKHKIALMKQQAREERERAARAPGTSYEVLSKQVLYNLEMQLKNEEFRDIRKFKFHYSSYFMELKKDGSTLQSNTLVSLAKDNNKYAQTIVDVIVEQISDNEMNPHGKLIILYLIDAIVQNSGGVYLNLFSRCIVKIFVETFQKVIIVFMIHTSHYIIHFCLIICFNFIISLSIFISGG
jgi:hypothetical protein